MPRAANKYHSLAPEHPGIRVNEKGTTFMVRWQENCKYRERSFPTLEEAISFRKARGMGKTSPYNSEAGRRALEQLQNAPLQFGRAHRVIHGAKAQIVQEELVAKEEQVLGALPVRGSDGAAPHDRIVIRQLAESLVRRERITKYETDNGLLTGSGKVRPATELGLQLDARILNLCHELALTPRSRAALGLDLAVGSAVVQSIGLLDGRNPLDFDSKARQAAAALLLAGSDESQREVVIEGDGSGPHEMEMKT